MITKFRMFVVQNQDNNLLYGITTYQSNQILEQDSIVGVSARER